ncbi:DUF4175 domain-containing protein [Falsirhodobacter halotolerans]|uniref:DUF4175 domain-containing protein n=1 Tax=Falsirhodobacter halotolerans TaxID=1146892 RepID=UPI001FD1285E|nr:DUF4175 family protein [Falsirhodobacter halotolerans]MCJ8140523.1 DUF4175 domain-containing protein [Falsirhodobacter halotolerans]
MTGRNDPILARLARPIRLTLLGLWLERAARAFWPLGSLVLGGLALLMFGVQDHLPITALWAGCAGAGLGGLAALGFGLRRFRRPTRGEAMARLDASLPGQPIAAARDAQAVGADDPASAALWAAHVARMADRARAARAVGPRPDLAARDPYALRLVALTALATALIFGSVWRVATVADAVPAGSAIPTGPMWEAWVQPPAYTRQPTIYLNDLAAEALEVPTGSALRLRLYGDVDVALSDMPPQTGPDRTYALGRDGTLTLGDRAWRIAVRPDAAPMVAIPAPPERQPDGGLRLPFRAGDDYGITGGVAEVTLDLAAVDRRHGLTVDPEVRAPLRLDLPLPIRGDRRAFEEVLTGDLSKHPYANLPVTLRLEVTDAAGQTGVASMAMTLPGKRFFDPVAAAVAEMRRDLLWSRANAGRTGQVLRAVTFAPDDLFANQRAFLRLRAVIRALSPDLSPEDRDRIAEELWTIATMLEHGNDGDARARMARAQDRLSQAMRDGADPAEIEALMRELRQATDDYIDQLAQEGEGQQQAEGETQDLTGDQLQGMMDRIEQLMREGRMAEAQALMDQLAQMMRNLRVTEGEGQGEGRPGGGLGQTLRDQQQLSDDGFRGLQDGGDADDLADRQRALRDQLQGQEGDEADRARRAMEEAEQALRGGDLSGAFDRQAEAIEALRDGMRAEAERQTPGQPEGQATQTDPLGRPTGPAGRIGSDDNLAEGEAEQRRRAEALLDEIRRRAGEQMRPEEERDYLRRLLDLF